MSSPVTRPLFGGAIVAETPANLIDASNVRQVPDTQEVLLYPNSSVSIIVEILQRVEPVHFEDAIKFHFDSVAHDNSAQSILVNSVTIVPNDRGDDTPSAVILKGSQHVPKFNRTTPDDVRIYMALFRVEHKEIDLVVTFNVPVMTQDGGAVGSEGLEQAESDFHKFVTSFRICDYGLFA